MKEPPLTGRGEMAPKPRQIPRHTWRSVYWLFTQSTKVRLERGWHDHLLRYYAAIKGNNVHVPSKRKWRKSISTCITIHLLTSQLFITLLSVGKWYIDAYILSHFAWKQTEKDTLALGWLITEIPSIPLLIEPLL